MVVNRFLPATATYHHDRRGRQRSDRRLMPRIRLFKSNALVQLINDDRSEERLGSQRGRENLIVISAISIHFAKFAG